LKETEGPRRSLLGVGLVGRKVQLAALNGGVYVNVDVRSPSIRIKE